ncbi:MAG: bifunctional 2-keto-4-hydroxyglutarate aldolase/2-keto-3-deoxy-6-phosphogluconate aldolase, partial [Oscillospiraceae bacterium]|nr:bifunctional 2-keto-4-hydroxyglutarate aldolase/2-keto-3-deoxy-6-phosphogluconate aldolase [Oscillospiraceae bacterium]
MDKEDVYGRIASCGVVAVIRADTGEAALRIAEACISGGITAVELTFTVPFADQILRELAARHKGGSATVGAGTVLDPETARIALLSGAQYVVSPSFNPEVVRLCNRYRTLCVPGVMTVGEAVAAMEAGADMLKVFPSGLFGKAIIK